MFRAEAVFPEEMKGGPSPGPRQRRPRGSQRCSVGRVTGERALPCPGRRTTQPALDLLGPSSHLPVTAGAERVPALKSASSPWPAQVLRARTQHLPPRAPPAGPESQTLDLTPAASLPAHVLQKCPPEAREACAWPNQTQLCGRLGPLVSP